MLEEAGRSLVEGLASSSHVVLRGLGLGGREGGNETEERERSKEFKIQAG